MAAKGDFSEPEWDSLRKGVTGAGMLVSISDRDFTDTFGEAGAMAKFLAGQRTTGSTQLVRDIAAAGGSPFGLTTSPDRVRNETMEALRASVGMLTTRAPEDVDAYRELVLGLAATVAEAKGGETPVEAAAIGQIREALNGA